MTSNKSFSFTCVPTRRKFVTFSRHHIALNIYFPRQRLITFYYAFEVIYGAVVCNVFFNGKCKLLYELNVNCK